MVGNDKREREAARLAAVTARAEFLGVLFVLQLTGPEAVGYTPPSRKLAISNSLRYAGPRLNRSRRTPFDPSF
jgi:hypothetical protein